jgi:protoporphyrinogen oxidase
MMGKRVIVLGAGITGLSTAWKLAENGFNVEVIENSSRLGGLSASYKKDGFVFDFGIHGWFPSQAGNEKIIDLIVGLSEIEWNKVKKKTKIYLSKRYIPYPLEFRDIFLSLKPIIATFCFFDFLKSRFKNRLGLRTSSDTSFKGWIVNRFGDKLYEIYFGPYATKVWGINPSLLASQSLLRRVTTVSIWDLIIKAIFNKFNLELSGKKNYPQQPKSFLYPKGGAYRVAEFMAERIKNLGGKIILNAKPLKLNLEGSNIKEIVVECSGVQKNAFLDYVISTIPLDRLTQIIFPPPSKRLLAIVDTLKYRSMILLFLMINKYKITDSQWIYYSEPKFLFNRINEFTNISPEFSPSGKTGLCLEVTCFENDNIWNMFDEELYKECLKGLESLELTNAKEIEGYSVIRISHAYPVCEIDTEEKLKEVFGYFKNISNLYLAGRQALFRYINMDECVKNSLEITDNILTDIKKHQI